MYYPFFEAIFIHDQRCKLATCAWKVLNVNRYSPKAVGGGDHGLRVDQSAATHKLVNVDVNGPRPLALPGIPAVHDPPTIGKTTTARLLVCKRIQASNYGQ